MKNERMRAVVIVSHSGVEQLEVREVARPAAVGDRVRVRVHAAGLNRADVLQRRGHYPAPPGVPPDIPGLEFAGEVEQTGDEVSRWQKGQRVFGITAGAAQAEYVVVPESCLAEIPPNLDWTQAAAVPEVFITAHDALFSQASLEMGERVLVHAAGSGVGTAAIQLARAAGAIVYGTARTADKLERARPLGLDEAVVVNGEAQVFVDAVRGWTGGTGVNVVLDTIGASYLAANLQSLAPRGRMVFVGTLGGARGELDFRMVMSRRLTLIGTVLRSRSNEEKARAVDRFGAHVVPLLMRGAVRPVVDRVYGIDEVRAAYEHLESNASFGKIILRVS